MPFNDIYDEVGNYGQAVSSQNDGCSYGYLNTVILLISLGINIFLLLTNYRERIINYVAMRAVSWAFRRRQSNVRASTRQSTIAPGEQQQNVRLSDLCQYQACQQVVVTDLPTDLALD